MDDKEIISLYIERDERAIAETQKKYRPYLLYIARAILENEEEAKECENDVYLGVWNSVPPNIPTDLRSYAGAVCRRAALKRVEKRRAAKRGGGRADLAFEELDGVLSGDGDCVDELALREALERFLLTLSKEARIVFVQKYWYFKTVAEIAQDRKTSENSVKVSLYRSREKLKKFLQKEGFEK